MSRLFQRLRKLGLKKRVVANEATMPRRGTLTPCPLSLAQQRLWFLEQLESGHPVYTIPAAIRCTGPLSMAALEQSLNEIVKRHEALRTTFAVADGQPVQVIAPELTLRLSVVDCRGFPADEAEAEIKQPFDLTQGPLVRATLFRLDPQEHILLLTLHHTVADDQSIEVFARELATL